MSDYAQQRLKAQLRSLLLRPENRYCVDCRAEGPTWASINLGIFMCLDCAGIHRSLGTHITKVRSVTMDTWQPDWVKFITAVGNYRANLYWECNNKFGEKLSSRASGNERLQFIRAKYEEKKWYGIPKAPNGSTAKGANANTNNNNSNNAGTSKPDPAIPKPQTHTSSGTHSHHHPSVSTSSTSSSRSNSNVIKNHNLGLFAGMGGGAEAKVAVAPTSSYSAPPPAQHHLNQQQQVQQQAPAPSQPTSNNLSSQNKPKPRVRKMASGSPWVKRRPNGGVPVTAGANPTTTTVPPASGAGPVNGTGPVAVANGGGDDLFDGLNVQDEPPQEEQKAAKATPIGLDFASLLDDEVLVPERALTDPIMSFTNSGAGSGQPNGVSSSNSGAALGSLDDLSAMFGAQAQIMNAFNAHPNAQQARATANSEPAEFLYGNPFGEPEGVKRTEQKKPGLGFMAMEASASPPNEAPASIISPGNNGINSDRNDGVEDEVQGGDAGGFDFLGGGGEEGEVDDSAVPEVAQEETQDTGASNSFGFLENGENPEGEAEATTGSEFKGFEEKDEAEGDGGGDSFGFLGGGGGEGGVHDDEDEDGGDGSAFGFLGEDGADGETGAKDDSAAEKKAAGAQPVLSKAGNFQGFDMNAGANGGGVSSGGGGTGFDFLGSEGSGGGTKSAAGASHADPFAGLF